MSEANTEVMNQDSSGFVTVTPTNTDVTPLDIQTGEQVQDDSFSGFKVTEDTHEEIKPNENQKSQDTTKKVEDKTGLESKAKSEDKSEEKDNPFLNIREDKRKNAREIEAREKGYITEKRDYSVFKPEDLNYLRGIKNDLYQAIKPRILHFYEVEKQNEELQTKLKEAESKVGKPQSVYETPDGITLTPEYKELVGQYSMADHETKFYQQQIALCQSGKDWQIIDGWDENNNPILRTIKNNGNAAQNAQNVAKLTLAVTRGDNIKQQLVGKANQMQNEYVTNYKTTVNDVLNKADAYIKSLPEDLRPSDKEVETLMNKFSPTIRSLPTSIIAAKALLVTDHMSNKYRELEKKLATQAKNQIDEKSAGPKNITRGGAAKKSDNMVTMIDDPNDF